MLETGEAILKEAQNVLSQHGLVSETTLVDTHGGRVADIVVSQAKE
jgi:hypothetical protein